MQGAKCAIGYEDETLNGMWVHVNTISEEGPFPNGIGRDYTTAEFDNVLQWSVGHEIGHQLIREQNGGQWVDNHLDVAGALMTTQHPGAAGISAITLHDAEIGVINLLERASVEQPE